MPFNVFPCTCRIEKDLLKQNCSFNSRPSNSRFTVDAVVTQHVQPDVNDSSFRPIQRQVRLRVTFTVQ